MEDHASPPTPLLLAALALFPNEQTGVPETPSSRSGSPVVVPTVSAKQPKLSSRAHPWQRVDLQLLGEHPPLDPDLVDKTSSDPQSSPPRDQSG